MRIGSLTSGRILALAVLLLGAAAGVGAEPGPATPPDLTRGGKLENTGFFHLGPTGAQGRMFVKDYMTDLTRQILISKVDPGSAADGVLAVGDVILGIGTKRFTTDARKSFGRAINRAETEAAKGILKLLRWRAGKVETVSLQLRVLGTYSDTAPYDCPKSRRIMDEALAYLARKKQWSRFSLEVLAYLASGKPEYVRLAREHIHQARWASPDTKCGNSAWNAGYLNLVMTEYYLATGDKYVLPAIREYAVKTAMGQGAPGTWGHHFVPPGPGGKLHGRIMGYGGLNCAGLPCFLSLVLARKCGVSHPEVDAAIERSSTFFSQFVGRGSVGYGYHRPSLERRSNGRNALSSNGKNGTAAVAFTALGGRDVSRYFSKLVTSSYDEREYGHSGNSYGIFWGMPGANCAGPKAAAAFAKERRWYTALTRKADGSFITQPLGGYYGGRGIMNATVAHVIANAMPLRKIHLTGKGATPGFHLNDAEVTEAIDSGRWRLADYDRISADELIARLDCWSTAGREWIAEGLGAKKDNVVPKLVAMLKSPDPRKRAGACTALGYQGTRAAPAVQAVAKALTDKDSTVRVAASYALMRIGQPARKAVPDMLKAVLATEETQSMRPTQMAVAYSLGHNPSGTAPLYFKGMFPSCAEGENPLAGMDRDLLYPALRRLLRHNSARVRGCGAYAFKYLTAEDVGILAQDIYDASRNVAINFPMFGDTPRQHGLDLMARFRFREGVTLCLESMDVRSWGGKNRFGHRFNTLQEYRGAARSVLPMLKELRPHFRTGEHRALLEKTIRVIENDANPPKLTSIDDLVDRRLARQLAPATSKQKRVELCRKIMNDRPRDYFLQAAVLRQLVAMLQAGAFDDILAAVGRPDDRLRAAAVKLATELPGKDMTARWAKQLPAARGRKLAGIIEILARRGDAKMLPLAAGFLKHAEPAVRLAAIEAVGALGGRKALGLLLDTLGNAEADQERASAVDAVVVACRSGGNVDRAAAAVMAALPKATDTARCSLIRVLGQLGSASALAAAAAEIGSENADVRKAALDVLATSPDAKATDVLLARAEKARRGRAKSDLLSACLRRVVLGRAPTQQGPKVLGRIVVLGEHGGPTRSVLEELVWQPWAGALPLARSCMKKGDKRPRGIADYAAKAAVAIAEGMDMTDQTQRQAAVEAVREALAVAKDEKTTAAAKAFIAKHGS